jgi:DNA-binding beta-propeller fold protein YncE
MLAIFALTAVFAATAAASPTIYWTDYSGGRLMQADVQTGVPATLVASAGSNPNGVAIDRTTGRIYWAVRGNNEIRSVLPDGTDEQTLNVAPGSIDSPVGVAIDWSRNRIYWANSNDPTTVGIGWASLDGSGDGGLLNTGTAESSYPQGVAVDVAGGRIYWANTSPTASGRTLAYASLDGSGTGGTIPIDLGGSSITPIGMALSVSDGKLYWTDYNASFVGVVSTDGSGQQLLNPGGAAINGPGGAAFDPSSGLVYIANYGGHSISFLDPSAGTGGVLISSGAGYPWGSPAISGTGQIQATPAQSFSVDVGSAQSQTLTYANTGDYPVAIAGVTLSGGAGSFSVTGSCANSSLAVGATCTEQVTFKPSASGSHNGTLQLTTDAGPVVTELSGQAGESFLSSLAAVRRCAVAADAGKLSAKFQLNRAQPLVATLARQVGGGRAPASCPKPFAGSNTSGKVKSVKTGSVNATAGAATRTLKQIFNTKSLSPGHYRLQLSYTGADHILQRRTTWFWVTSK